MNSIDFIKRVHRMRAFQRAADNSQDIAGLISASIGARALEKEIDQVLKEGIVVFFPELKSKIDEIYEENKHTDGWKAWSSLCLWLAQYEAAQQQPPAPIGEP